MKLTINTKPMADESSTRDIRCIVFKGHALHRFRGALSVVKSHAIFDESMRIAVETGFPALVLPLLVEERLRHAAEQTDFQPEHAHAA